MAWWYRALGTLRTRILAFWRPGKPKTDFDQVQIEEFSKTHFLTSNGSRIDPKSATKDPKTPLDNLIWVEGFDNWEGMKHYFLCL